MENNTWIKNYRKMTEWEWYKDIPVNILFNHLLRIVNYVDKNWRGKNVLKGEIITSIDSLSKDTGLSPMQIRTAIKKLKITQEITSSSTNTFTHIKIIRWSQYQSEITNEQQTNNKPITTTKEDNKERKQKENTNTECFDIFWTSYPNKVGKPNAIKKYKEQEHSQIIEGLERWKEYWDYSNTEQRYIPHPATWLHQERYKDTPPEIKSNIISV